MDESQHFGQLLAGRVLSEQLAGHPAGTPVEVVLRSLYERVLALRSGTHTVSRFSIDAWKHLPTFGINAIKRKESEVTGTFTLHPDSDLSTSGGISPSSGTTFWNLINEVGAVGSGSYHCSTNAWIVHGFTDPVMNPAMKIRKIEMTTYVTNPAPAGTGISYIQNPATGTNYTNATYGQSFGGYSTVTWTTRPWDGQPWTIADLTDLRIRMQGGGIIGNLTVHQVYATVYWYWTPYKFMDAYIAGVTSGGFTLDAVIPLQVTTPLTLDAWIYDDVWFIDAIKQAEQAGGFGIDALLARTIIINAIKMKSQSASLTANAVKFKTMTSDEATLYWSHQYTEAVNPSWTHTPGENAKAIVVVVSASGDVASNVTYGNVGLTNRRQTNIFGRYTEAWTLTNLSGRTDDVVRVTGIGNAYASSTILEYPTNITFSSVSGVSSWFGPATGADYTTTMSDTLPGSALKMHFFIMGGEGTNATGDPGPPELVAYGTGTWLSGASTSGDNSGAVVLTVKGPDTGTVTGGVHVNGPGDPNMRYYWSLLMEAEAAPAGIVINSVRKVFDQTGSYTINAHIPIPNLASFSADARIASRITVNAIKHQAYEKSFTMNAIIRKPTPASFTLDALLERTFSMNAYIVAAGAGGQQSTLGDATLGDITLGG